MTVGSSATVREASRIWARVKIIEPKAPTSQITEDVFRKVRIFSPEVERLPSTSRSKNAMAKSVPTVANPPSKFKYLNVVVKRFIDQ